MRLGFVAPPGALVDVYREAGHDVFVLAHEDDDTVDEGVERLSADGEPQEYRAWSMRRGLRVCFLFGERRFDEVQAMRDGGVVTVGALGWHGFGEDDAGRARSAYDLVVALSDAEARRFAAHGLLAPRVHWGAPPDLATPTWEAKAPYAPVSFLCDAREPADVAAAAKAFGKSESARLIALAAAPGPTHPNVSWRRRPTSRKAAIALLVASDVRLFLGRGDASAFDAADAVGAALPLVAPDAAPWSEHVRAGLTGLLVKGAPKGGSCDVELSSRDLAEAIRRLSDRRVVDAMTANTRRLRDFDYAWARTKDELLRLLDHALAVRR